MSIQSNGAKIAAIAAFMAISMSANAAKHLAAAPATGASDKVHCEGLHSCKGNSDCKTAEHACKGKNACKGHGYKSVSAADCKTKGGKVAS